MVDWAAAHGPADTAVRLAGVGAALVGAWLLGCALLPGLRRRLRMAAPAPEVRVTLDRTAAARILRERALGVPGVVRARVSVRRRRARVRAGVGYGRPEEVRAEVVRCWARACWCWSCTVRPLCGSGCGAWIGTGLRTGLRTGLGTAGRRERRGGLRYEGVGSMAVIRRGAVNRALLGTVGLALLAGGTLLAVGDGSGLGRVGREVPGWWSGRAADGVLLDRGGLARLRENGWWTPAVIVALTLVLALLVRWFAAQVSASGPRRVGLRGAGLTLRRRAWERAMTSQAGAVDGVAHARVRLAGRPLRASVTLVVEPEARPAEVVRRVAAGVVSDARRCAGVRGLPTDVRVRVANRRERRAR
ncbi:DUF6286 domain-containing protein [Streptomyces microflavus]